MTTHPDNYGQIYNQLMRFFLEREIANFYEFLKSLDEGLGTRQLELSKNIEFSENDLNIINNDEHRKELINLKVEAEQVKSFTNLLRQSFLTSLYSFMELWFLRDCYLDSKHRDGGQSYNSIKGKGIDKAKIYFAKVKKSNYPFGTSQDWQWIKYFQLLRDCIVHRQGSLTGFSDFEVDPNLEKFVHDDQGLNLFGINNNQIFIEFEFCQKSLEIVHRFMIKVLAIETETN